MPVAVQTALSMLKEAAVFTTRALRGAGVAKLIAAMLNTVLADHGFATPCQRVALAEGFDFYP